MKRHIKNDLVYYTDEALDQSGNITHVFTTRLGGVSKGSLSSLNMGVNRPDTRENILENYRRVCDTVGLDYTRCVLAQQAHTSNIRIVTEADAGKGLIVPSDIKDTDGLVTNIKNLPLVIFYADCVPVLLYDETSHVIATVHSGWRGTVSKIAENAINIMNSRFGCRPENITAVIGPSLCREHFETGLDVAEKFSSYPRCIVYKNDKAYIDLWQVNRQILQNCGVSNINISGLCTVCDTYEFFSHRGCGPDTGRMALIACLK